MLHDPITAAHCRFPAVFISVCMPVAAKKAVSGTPESGGFRGGLGTSPRRLTGEPELLLSTNTDRQVGLDLGAIGEPDGDTGGRAQDAEGNPLTTG